MSLLWIVIDFYQRVFIWLRRRVIARPIPYALAIMAATVILLEGVPRLLAPLIDPYLTFLILILAVGPLVLMIPFHAGFKKHLSCAPRDGSSQQVRG